MTEIEEILKHLKKILSDRGLQPVRAKALARAIEILELKNLNDKRGYVE